MNEFSRSLLRLTELSACRAVTLVPHGHCSFATTHTASDCQPVNAW